MSSFSEHRTDQDLLSRIERSPGSKAGFKQLVREFGLGGGRDRRDLQEQLERLETKGTLKRVRGQIWGVPPAPTGQQSSVNKSTAGLSHSDAKAGQATFSRTGRERLKSGRLELHRDGYGFVRSEEKSASESRNADIFIPPNALHGAMHGDVVLVDEDSIGRDGRRSGHVARVLTRRNQTVVGTFHYGVPEARRSHYDAIARKLVAGAFIKPWDARLGEVIEIAPGSELPSTTAPSAHRTLQDQAAEPQGSVLSLEIKSEQAPTQVQPDSLEGQVVEVEITAFARPGRPAQGRVIEVLGYPDAFGVDVEIVIRKHGIPHTFPAHVLAEAQERARMTVPSLSQKDLSFREDFREFPTVTIDGENARDFDDAVLVRNLENGNTELQVHIADVSNYVLAGSALDIEARVRGTSVYFPDRAVPMLPHDLSSNMCSLLPDHDRLVLSCIMEINAEGDVVGYRVAEGIIRSVKRLTYTSVQHCLNASLEAEQWNLHQKITAAPIAEDELERKRVALEFPNLPADLDRMLRLALQLNKKRVRRGSIDFDLPEPIVEFDPDGNMKAIVRSERGWSHRLIEEFMLSANECIATWLTAQGIPSIYRIHEMPDPKRIMDFEETAATFGQSLGIGSLPVKRFAMKTDRRESQRNASRGRSTRTTPVHEAPEQIPVTPQMYQRLVRRIAGTPEERILSYLMLRSLKQARYSEKNEGHFALASPCYTHFTSPIRRYPDLIVHRLVRTMLRTGANPHGGPVLASDPQPWKAEASRSKGSASVHLASAAPLEVRTSKLVRGRKATAGEVDLPEAKRAGRIGWGMQMAQPGHTSSSSGERESSSEGEHADSISHPLPATELQDIATESSQAERRASDAERELIEWKKLTFMASRIGDDFKGIVLSITKYGFFVELDELFVEGLVPLSSLTGDFYSFRDTDRVISGARSGHTFRVGDRVEVILDRIDHQQQRLQFALLPGTQPTSASPSSRAKTKAKSSAAKAKSHDAKAGRAKPPKRKRH